MPYNNYVVVNNCHLLSQFLQCKKFYIECEKYNISYD